MVFFRYLSCLSLSHLWLLTSRPLYILSSHSFPTTTHFCLTSFLFFVLVFLSSLNVCIPLRIPSFWLFKGCIQMRDLTYMALGAICITDPNVTPALTCFPQPIIFKPFKKLLAQYTKKFVIQSYIIIWVNTLPI